MKELFKKIMVMDVFLSGFFLAYEFIYIWEVRHFDDYNIMEMCMFVAFILSKIVLNLSASYTYATKIGWQFSTSVVNSTFKFRILHL